MSNRFKHLKEWIRAIGWAFLIAWCIRTFLVQGAFIPSSSMEESLFPGDFILISKLHYGTRLPMTPLSVPFMHGTFPLTKIPAYLSILQLPYLRLPGLGSVQRNDILVFNYPSELEKPVDKRTYFVKRCTGLPGDTFQIALKEVLIGGVPLKKPTVLKLMRHIRAKAPLSAEWLDSLGIHEGGLVTNMFDYEFPLTDSTTNSIVRHRKDLQLSLRYESPGTFQAHVFPYSRQYPYNADNWGPVIIPAKGMKILLNDTNLVLYEKIIRDYEGNSLELRNDTFLIDGVPQREYTFKQNYYFVMGDNRDQSADSRFWGFLPENHIIGKAWICFFSYNPQKSGWRKIRWDRIFHKIDEE